MKKDNEISKNQKYLLITVIFAVLVLITVFTIECLSKDKKSSNELKTDYKNNLVKYDDVISRLDDSEESNIIVHCDCSEVTDYSDYYKARCEQYAINKSDAAKVVKKLASTSNAEELPTSTACAEYEFIFNDKNKEEIISGWTGENNMSILSSYDDHGYAFNFNENIIVFFDNIIANMNGNLHVIDEPFEITEKKPVLYLYPKKDKTKVTVSFAKPEKLTTTYPKFKDKWVVTANKNGDLTDANGNYYYALYWEEKQNKKVDFKTGYYVTKDDAISFLEDKLKYIGLNDKERNEFIMYWLPILEKNKKSVVHFELTEERQKYNEIKIEPKPDSLLRISMHVKKVDKKPKNLEKQQLSNFKRKGFVAVEWGGVIHKSK